MLTVDTMVIHSTTTYQPQQRVFMHIPINVYYENPLLCIIWLVRSLSDKFCSGFLELLCISSKNDIRIFILGLNGSKKNYL